MNPTRVFVISSSPLLRAGLRSMLADAMAEARLEIVGDGAPESSGVELTLSGAEVLLISDDSMPEEGDTGILEALASPNGEAQALVLLSGDASAALRLKEMTLAGWGVVSPDAPPEELAAAINAVARGFVVMPRSISEQVIEDHPMPEGQAEPLTAREGEVLELLSQGLANKSIARKLSISEHTVKFHVSSIYSKLQVRSRAEAVSRGARLGLLKL